MENGESIDVAEFVKARSREIEAIEKSISVSHKQSLLWQRLPHYKRRRNRNYDKRTNRKFTRRKKDRHPLRTHTFYAKRFFMLKTASFSVPIRRRLKSAKYIYKSQGRGFIFDESFRGAYVYSRCDAVAMRDDGALGAFVAKIDFGAEGVVQYIDNQYEAIVDGDRLIVVGRDIGDNFIEKIECLVSVMMKGSDQFDRCETARIYRSGGDALETHKIVCRRSEIMNIFQALTNSGLIPVCIEEIHRLSLENDRMTVYDNVGSSLYAEIENAVNGEIIAKYDRTPASKKQRYDLARLFLQNEPVGGYFTFRVVRGACGPGAEIFSHDAVVGRVVRSAYKFTCGSCCGLGFSYGVLPSDPLTCKNLQQGNHYPIELTRRLG